MNSQYIFACGLSSWKSICLFLFLFFHIARSLICEERYRKKILHPCCASELIGLSRSIKKIIDIFTDWQAWRVMTNANVNILTHSVVVYTANQWFTADAVPYREYAFFFCCMREHKLKKSLCTHYLKWILVVMWIYKWSMYIIITKWVYCNSLMRFNCNILLMHFDSSYAYMFNFLQYFCWIIA